MKVFINSISKEEVSLIRNSGIKNITIPVSGSNEVSSESHTMNSSVEIIRKSSSDMVPKLIESHAEIYESKNISTDENSSKEIKDTLQVATEAFEGPNFFVSLSKLNTKCVCLKDINKNDLKINPSRFDNHKNLVVNQKMKYHDICFLKNNPHIDITRYL